MIQLNENDIFAAFRLPGSEQFCLMIQETDDAILFSQNAFNDKGFAFFPFDQNSELPLFIRADKIYHNQKFSFTTDKISHIQGTTEAKYLETAEKFINAVDSGFKKLVLSRTKTLTAAKNNVFELFEILEKQYKNAFIYLLNHPHCGCWAGASPEVLLAKEGSSASTTALAGTQLIKDQKYIAWERKETEEQAMVMEYIEKVLEIHNIDYETSGPYNKIVSSNAGGELVHLATDYYFHMQKDSYNLILDLHPTPAVCGSPKSEAFRFILGNEKHTRKYYSGFLGPINHTENDEFHLYVNIRCMQIFSNQFLLYAGGGINQGSVKEKEWQETENKAKTLISAIAMYRPIIKS